MLKLLALLIASAHAQTVTLNKYLVLPTPAAAHTRAQQACTQYGCRPGTTEWWAVVLLTDGTGAVEVRPSGLYGASASVGPCAVGCGLTAAEQSQLQTAAQLGSLLPVAVPLPPP